METNRPAGVSILEPIGSAVDKTSQMLFRPFDVTKWFAIGFAAWLAYLGAGGGAGHFNNRYRGGSFHNEVNEFKNAVVTNLPIVLSVGGAVLLFIIALSILFLWLRSRGQFIFLNCVAKNRTEIAEPWHIYSNHGNSLFLFKLVVGAIHIALSLCFLVPLGILIWIFSQTDFKALAAGQIVAAALIAFSMFILWLIFGALYALTNDLVVPIMYMQSLSAVNAWKRLLKIISTNKATFLLYLLFIFAVAIVLGMISSAIILAACCCFCCVAWVFVIPLVGAYLFKVLTLPLWVWRRAYSAMFIAQFGPEYDVFVQPQTVVAPTEPGTI